MSFAANRVAGVAYVYVDGAPLPLGGTITVGPWDTEKETVLGLSGVVGYKEMPIASFIEIEVITANELDIQAVQQVRDSTVVAELANGHTYTLRNAWSTKAPEMNGAEGNSTLRFESKRKAEKS